MRDALELRRTLEALLATAILGCSREEPKPLTIEPDPPPKKTVLAKPSVAPELAALSASGSGSAAIAPMPLGLSHTGGGCAPTRLCKPAADVAKIALSGSGTALGCPKALDPKAGASLAWFTNGPLDEADTKAARVAPASATQCCYRLSHPCGGGRPLLDEGEARVAPVRAGDSWSVALDLGARDEGEGRAWLEDARMEHASVASFARAALELMAVGAPPELVAACHRAALEEIEHARLCFAMASAHLGVAHEPGPLSIAAPRPCSLVDVARNTVIEGCIAESAAVLMAMRRPATGVAREILDRIVRDETEHAALAFRIVRFCIAVGGDEVRRAVLAVEEPSAPNAREAFALIVRPLLASPLTPS